MKAEKFSESLNNINDRYIEEAVRSEQTAPQQAFGGQLPPMSAAPVPNPSGGQKPGSSKSLKVWRIIAIAACAVLVAGIAVTAAALLSGKGNAVSKDAAMPAPVYDEGPAEAGGGMYNGAYVPEEDFNYYDYSQEMAGEAEGGGAASGAASGSAGSMNAPHPQGENAKIIYTARLSVESTEFDSAQKTIEEATVRHNGYFENMDLNNNSSSYRSANYVIRIPAQELDAFLNEAGTFGHILSANRNAEDVSEYYYDTEARLESARAKLQRLQELYAQAQNMSDIIVIENEISNVEWEIDSLSGTLKHYESQVDYSTVTLSLSEVYKITEEAAPLTFSEKISGAFSDGLRSFGEACENIVIWFAESWIWVLIALAGIAAAIIIPVKVTQKLNKDEIKEDPAQPDQK